MVSLLKQDSNQQKTLSSLTNSDSSQPYYNVIAAKEGNENKEVYKKIVEYYQSPETAKKIEEVSKRC